MKVGTKSLLFGVHQIFIHTYYVTKAWILLYDEIPSIKEFICIMIHDIGYFGKSDMDGEEGSLHPELGANIANSLFGKSYYYLCLYHSRDYAKRNGSQPSKLCWADKYSLCLENNKFYLFRARVTSELKEYRQVAQIKWGIPLNVDDISWLNAGSDYLQIESYENSKKFKNSTGGTAS